MVHTNMYAIAGNRETRKRKPDDTVQKLAAILGRFFYFGDHICLNFNNLAALCQSWHEMGWNYLFQTKPNEGDLQLQS